MEENEMMEWEIVEYDPLDYIGDEINSDDCDYGYDEKRSKLGWIIGTGLSLGKKVVITGIVISSVPLILPPLLAVSALGCALSLPFGFIFASYACTDKLMTKLLSPRPSMLLEYDQTALLQPEQEQAAAIEYQKAEEQEEKDVVKDALESRIELAEDHDHDHDHDNLDVGEEQEEKDAVENALESRIELVEDHDRDNDNLDVGEEQEEKDAVENALESRSELAEDHDRGDDNLDVGIEYQTAEEQKEKDVIENALEARSELVVDHDRGDDNLDVRIEYQRAEEKEEKDAIENALESRSELVVDHDRGDDNLDVGIEYQKAEEQKEKDVIENALESRSEPVVDHDRGDENLAVGIEYNKAEEQEEKDAIENALESRSKLVEDRDRGDDNLDVGIEYQRAEEKEEKDAIENALESRSELVEDHDRDGDNLDVGIELINAKEETQKQIENDNLMGPNTADIGGVNATKTDNRVAAAPELRNTEDDATLEVQIDKFTVENEGGKKVAEKEEDHISQGTNENVEKLTVATVKGTSKKNAKGKSKSKETDQRRGKRKTASALTKFPGKRREPEGDERHEETFREEKGTHKKIETSGENNDTKQVSANSGVHNILLDDGVENPVSSLEKEVNPVGMNGENNTSTGVLLASEIGVSVLASDDGIDKKIEHRAVTIYNDSGENYSQSKTIADDGEFTLEIASSTGKPEPKRDKEIPEAKEERGVGAVEGGVHSDEEGLIGEEKIWKKMEAIRVIVGYKGPRSGSYVEELKALYLFTGIEPPLPSNSTAEFHNKLGFLMSVIGLK